MDMATLVQNLDEAVWILHSVNTFGKYESVKFLRTKKNVNKTEKRQTKTIRFI